MFVVEVTGAKDAAGTLETLYFSDAIMTTGPADTPAHKSFIPLLKDPGSIGVSVFGDGVTAGSTKLETGSIELDNTGRRFDYLLNWSFDNRAVVIRQGEAGAAYPADFATIFTGTIRDCSTDRRIFTFNLKDRQFIFERPVLTDTYAGTNVGPAGIEGLATDIKGQVKPQICGKVYEALAKLVNSSKLVYQIHNGALSAISNVYVRGAALTFTSDYADLTTLNAAALAGGQYATCLALGLFRVGSLPDGPVTANAQAGANDAARTAGQLLKSLALAAGLTNAEIDNAAIAALDAANTAICGQYIDDDRSFLEAMDFIAASIGAWYGFDLSGKFTAAIWKAPSGSPLINLADYFIGDDFEIVPLKDVNVPIYSAKVKHSRYNLTQTSGYATSLTADRVNALAQEFRTELATNPAIKDQYLTAGVLEIETCLTDANDAQSEAARLLALHSVARGNFEGGVRLDLIARYGIALGAVLTLTTNRFGLAGGRLVRVRSVRLNLAKNRAAFAVWG